MISELYLRLLQEKKDEKILSWIFMLIFFVPTINYYLSYFLRAYNLPTTTVPLYAGLYALVLYSYFSSIKKSLSPFLLLLVIFFLYSITLIFWPQNMEFMFGDALDACYNPLYRIVFLGLPLVFIPFVISDFSAYEKPLVILSVLNNIIGIIAFWMVVVGKQQAFEYMTFAYNLLFSSCFLFVYSRKRKNYTFLLLAVFSLLTLVFLGSRGAMMCVCCFFVVLFFTMSRGGSVQRGMIVFSFIGLSVLTYVFFADIMNLVMNVFDYFGFNSRVVNFIQSSDFAESQGRSRIFENMLNRITESPFYGYGIFGDRVLNRDVFQMSTGYAHNIFLELLIDFGLLFGILFSGIYLFSCFFFLKYSTKNVFIYCLYLAIFSSTFVKLLVTGSYLTDQYFYLLLGGFVLVYKFCYRTLKERIF